MMKFREDRVRPHPAMDGKKCIERHGGEWWVSYTVYSLLMTDFDFVMKSLTIIKNLGEQK